MTVNITSISTSSNGVWQGDNPLDFAFPLLIVQTTLILALSRFLAFLLKPLRQPKVIAEIIGGILLGPSALGRNQNYLHRIFPSWSTPILESVASIGLLFFLFLVGLELDLSSIRRSGRKALSIATVGITLPFVCGVGVAFVLRKSVDGADKAGYGTFLVFMGVALSITAFPSSLVYWLNSNYSPPGWVRPPWPPLRSTTWLRGFCCSGMIKPAMSWVARRSPDSHSVDEAYICLTLAGVMVSGFVTDLIGIHSIFGAFVFGLTIPKGGGFSERLIERIEDFVTGLLLPLYFASSGLKTNVAKIRGLEAWGLLVLVITTACAGKIVGTFVVAMMCMIPARESLTLGVLMNTKGLVELIVLNIGKEKKASESMAPVFLPKTSKAFKYLVLNDEIFAILVLMALFTTFMTTPIVMTIYKPVRGGPARTHRRLRDFSSVDSSKYDLRILACVHGPGNVPSLISLIEATRSAKKSQLKLYVMRLVELTERSSSIIMVQRARKNGFPFINRFRRGQSHDRVEVAFEAYGQLGRVSVRPTTAISSLSTMHEDICHVAEEKRATMVILPFHKQWKGEGYESMENMGNGWRGVNQRVLKNSPCSVAVLVDRGFGSGPQQTRGPTSTVTQRICILFFGGPDDREALELGARMAEHPAVKVTVIRFVEKDGVGRDCDGGVQEQVGRVGGVRREGGEQRRGGSVGNRKSGDYDLVVVGKGRFPSTMVAELAERQAEHAELGPIGDILASSGQGIASSVLVIQQHDIAHAEEVPVSKVVNSKDATSNGDDGPSKRREVTMTVCDPRSARTCTSSGASHSICGSSGVSCSICASSGASCSICTSSGAFCIICASSRKPSFSWVLLFRGVTSFEPTGLPRFRRILDSFVNCPTGTSIRAGVFAAGICDFVTFFVSMNASGRIWTKAATCIIACPPGGSRQHMSIHWAKESSGSLVDAHYCSTSGGAMRLSFSENYYYKNHGIGDFYHDHDHVLVLVHVHEFGTILHSLQGMVQIQLDETVISHQKLIILFSNKKT
ncbi:Cation/H(+) antiporter 20 [Vitis vinifera]|uniref:Cation/H(+) antiporter 20 n=1 Tax=Vitis vinifera TaxID=29760 RepID=A0A438IPX0_VITVI|nr:Cation/H(+) antiporter 20 [Vitis vinifera]